MKINLKNSFSIVVLFSFISCASHKNSLGVESEIPKVLQVQNKKTDEPEAPAGFTEDQVKIARDLILANSNNLMLKKILHYHNDYYAAVHDDLNNLLAATSANLKKLDAKKARKLAIKNMKKDADLMDEIKKYVLTLDNFNDDDDSLIRFSYNKTPLILRKAAELLDNDEYFHSIVYGVSPNKFKWDELTFLGGIKNSDEKGTIAISAFTASLIYLLDDNELQKNLHNHSSIIYDESITDALLQNPDLLKKVQKNYHLFTAENNMISKVYEAYEFGGNKDLKAINNPAYVPLDCATGIGKLLNSENQNLFSTHHLASYYDEFFQENSAYWKFTAWNARGEIAKNLKPIKFQGLEKVKPGSVIVLRSLTDEKSLKDPKGYIGNGGHVGVVIGVSGNDLYYISWARNLGSPNKSGLGIDVFNIAQSEKNIAEYKVAFFNYELKTYSAVKKRR